MMKSIKIIYCKDSEQAHPITSEQTIQFSEI